MLAVTNTGSCVDLEVTVLDTGSHVECSQNIDRLQDIVLLGLCSELWTEFELWFGKKETCGIMTFGMNNMEID